MVSRYHWVSDSLNGLTSTTGVIPTRIVTVPANGRAVRLVTNCVLSGQTSQTGGYDWVGPWEFQAWVEINSSQYPTRRVYMRRSLTRCGFGALYDADLTVLNAKRVWTVWHALDDKDLGINIKQSYGGPGKGAITYSSFYSSVKPFNTYRDWMIAWDVSIKVLYYL